MNTARFVDGKNLPSDLVISGAALQGRKRAPNQPVEAVAFYEYSKVLADDAHPVAPRHLLQIARHLCGAGTAGLSLLRHGQANQAVMHLEAISGALAPYEGTDAPRDRSPCGLCLDAGTTILISKPERAFDGLHDVRPPIVEGLIAPLYDSTKNPLGTLWIAHHGTSRFSFDDVRTLEQLGVQMVLILRLLEQAKEYRRTIALLKSHQTAQRNLLAYELDQERGLRERAESEHLQTLAFKDAMVHEVNHRTKNTLQAAASLLSLHARTTSYAPVRDALLQSYGRLQLLAKAHELLYSDTDNAQNVPMPRLLQMLGDALRQSFADTCGGVELDLTSDPIALPAAEAIPIALIANEAVTNAYKHAFPNGSAGKIAVSLARAPDDTLTLRIADTGIGLRPGDDGEGGVGLKLTRMLASQLQCTLDIAGQADGAGTSLTLTIQRPAATTL